MSCISGMPTIMPKVTRSRFIWMNSFKTIAQRRWRLKRFIGDSSWAKASAGRAGTAGTKCWAGDSQMACSREVVLGRVHQADEDVFEAGADLCPFVLRIAHSLD